MGNRINYSLYEEPRISSHLSNVAIIGINSIIILAHSWYRNKRMVFKRVWICTEIPAACTLLSCILCLINAQASTKMSNAVIYELLVTGLLNWVTQLCDNAIFFYGYAAAVGHVSKRMKAMVL